MATSEPWRRVTCVPSLANAANGGKKWRTAVPRLISTRLACVIAALFLLVPSGFVVVALRCGPSKQIKV